MSIMTRSRARAREEMFFAQGDIATNGMGLRRPAAVKKMWANGCLLPLPLQVGCNKAGVIQSYRW